MKTTTTVSRDIIDKRNTMKTIIILALSLLLATTSCTAYHRHPVATVAALSVIGASAGGVTVALGYAGGGTADTWQGEFARYGGGQLSVIAIMVASGVVAWADGTKYDDPADRPCPAGRTKRDCAAPDGEVWTREDWNRDGRWMPAEFWQGVR